MEPEQSVIRVGQRCYRAAAVTRRVVSTAGAGSGASAGASAGSNTGRGYVEPGDEASTARHEADDDGSILPDASGKGFATQVEFPSACLGVLIGKRGRTLKEIQRDTGAVIHTPSRGGRGERPVRITAATRESVLLAKTRVLLILDQALERLPYTHFLCVPLTRAKDAIGAMQQRVRKLCPTMPPRVLVSPNKTHLTLLMLKLPTAQFVKSAVQVLQHTVPRIRDMVNRELGTSRNINLESLEAMNDDPSAAHVVYAEVGPPHVRTVLEDVAGLLIQAFQDADLLPEREVDQQRLRTGTGDRLAPKLHATVLNSKLGSTDGSRQSFDASVLLEAFRGTTIARCKLAAIHLSKRGEFAPSGFYHAEHVATL